MQTFFSLVKGYCAIVALIIPKSFTTGGYIGSPLTVLGSGFLSVYCTIKLCECALQTNIMNYSLLCEQALGKKGKIISDIVISIT